QGSKCPSDAPSLRAWRSFFSKATIFGYDIEDFGFFQQPDTFTFKGDQASRDDMEAFLRKSGHAEFKLVVDDGSHASSHQQISLATLFPHLKGGGMYVIEDLGWQPFAEPAKTLEVLERFCESGKFESPFITPSEAGHLEQTISGIEIYKPNDSEFAVISKRK